MIARRFTTFADRLRRIAAPVLSFASVERASAAQGYRPDIDGLRAIAIILVVGFHYFPNRVPGGYIGVDVFFVISGYLITGIILRNMARGKFGLLHFFSRRALRLFPALITVLAGLAAFCWFTFTASEYQALGKHLAGSAFYISNFILWGEAGYFDDSAITKPLLHMWSLAIEEQFYLFWPLFLLLLQKHLRRALFAILGLAGLSFALNLYFTGVSTPAAFYMPFTRGWELFAGAIIAYLHLYRPAWTGTPGNQSKLLVTAGVIAPYAGLALIGGALAMLDEKSAFPGAYALLPVAGTALLIAGAPDSWLHRRVLSHPLAVWVGLISYPLYLWHWPLLSVTATLGAEYTSRSLKRLLIGLSLLLAWATCKFVELPVRRRANATTIAVLAVLVSLVGAFGAAVYFGKGFPQRPGIAAFEQQVAEYEKKLAAFDFPFSSYPSARCKTDFPDSGWCVYAEDAPASVALVGDSHAHHFYPGLAEVMAEQGENLALLGSGGCPPLLDIESRMRDGDDWCRKGNAVIRRIADNPSIGIVILAANWHLYMAGNRFTDWDRKQPYWRILPVAPDALLAGVFARQLRATLRLLTEKGKAVAVMRQAPELDFNPKKCVRRPRGFTVRPACRLDRQEVQAYLDRYLRPLDAILADFPGVVVLDPVPHLCDGEGCPAFRDGKPLYRDHVHLSLFGSKLVARTLPLSSLRRRR